MTRSHAYNQTDSLASRQRVKGSRGHVDESQSRQGKIQPTKCADIKGLLAHCAWGFVRADPYGEGCERGCRSANGSHPLTDKQERQGDRIARAWRDTRARRRKSPASGDTEGAASTATGCRRQPWIASREFGAPQLRIALCNKRRRHLPAPPMTRKKFFQERLQ